MEKTNIENPISREESINVSLVPTPTDQYRRYRKLLQVTSEPGKPVSRPTRLGPVPITGSRLLIYKQDPSVAEVGIRKAYLPSRILTGPKDARIINGSPGIPPVAPNVVGDFIQTPGSDQFDAVHTFAVVRMTLTLYQRASGGAAVPWQWNGAANTNPLNVFPHGIPDVMNAFYSRNEKALKFGDFVRPGSSPPERIYTCRSFDIVAHEAGHAILDGLKPNWILNNNPPQTGGLHESFGDLTAIFLALSQLDQVEAVIAQTKADLHNKTFLADLAEQFGLALGRPNGLRNADNNLKLSEAGTEVHAISQVFTGAIYDILSDIFTFERNPGIRDDAATLLNVSQYVASLVLRAIKAAPNSGATYASVANQMLNITNADGKPVEYRNFIRTHFTVREVLVSSTPLTDDNKGDISLEAGIQDDPNAVQDRSTCCGTMQHYEYLDEDEEELLKEDIQELKKSFSGKKK